MKINYSSGNCHSNYYILLKPAEKEETLGFGIVTFAEKVETKPRSWQLDMQSENME